ncbi:CLUMA_CG004062, isoform A [Clunio marinus]|uniref:CLUMA_CG004062, isoform A n=1 Tax=Clunio marinus TaxID=568069 RepID=A0A1J1HSJ2_9DIPT|nr:CLUMA_CG004062, isoform A [Clunio marinus]
MKELNMVTIMNAVVIVLNCFLNLGISEEGKLQIQNKNLIESKDVIINGNFNSFSTALLRIEAKPIS